MTCMKWFVPSRSSIPELPWHNTKVLAMDTLILVIKYCAMNSTTKKYIKLFLPPILFKMRQKMNNGKAFKAVSLGERPDKQDIDLYWDESYANVLEEWGKDTVWIEIELMFSTLKGKVLDIACGTGPTIEILGKNPNLEVHGFDI